MLSIVLVHYHLRPGGCTTVLKSQYQLLRSAGHKTAVFCGNAYGNYFCQDIHEIPGLDYSCPESAGLGAEAIAERIVLLARSLWPGQNTIIHFHNPLLNKNGQLLEIIRILSASGLPVLLQVHDFAEDGRPEAYYSQDYPADVHYAVINRRDYEIMLASGLNEKGLHYLPNEVKQMAVGKTGIDLENYALYPVRAIRRKNLGEALLLSLFFPNREKLVITLPPNSPKDLGVYKAWRKIADELDFNVYFEAGTHYPFPDLVKNASFIITTSVNEGFGFASLEPWTVGLPVFGRYLPGIYDSRRLDLKHMYRKLMVPFDSFFYKGFIHRSLDSTDILSAVFRRFCRYDQKIELAASLQENGFIDFGLLDEKAQSELLAKIKLGSVLRERIKCLNPALAQIGVLEKSVVSRNRLAVKQGYGPGQALKALESAYLKTLNPVKQRINKGRLLDFFVIPEYFSQLKWGDPFLQTENL